MLTTDQVAARLNVSLRTVQKLVQTGALPAHKIGAIYRVSEQDLKKYVESTRTV